MLQLVLVLVSLSFPAAGDAFRELDYEHAQAAAVQEKKIVLIDFFTTWCVPCKKLDSVTWKDDAVLEWIGKQAVALKIDAEKNVELAKRFKIDSYPTVLLLKPDGTLIDRLVGYKEPKEFLAAATDALAGKDSLARAKGKLVGHEKDPMVRREDFAYPGPKPRSRETAILMLADGVEGASRALGEPTPSRIRGLVSRIIQERVQDGQLDECGLTLSELARIREAFIPVLTAIFHVRAPYPEDPRRRARADTDLRKEST